MSDVSIKSTPSGSAEAGAFGPVLFLISSSVAWLLAGLTLALVASVKLHLPGFLVDCSYMTFGRIDAAARNSLVYGFAAQAGLGLGLWLLAHLGSARLAGGWLIAVAAVFWNLGLTFGIGAIIAGQGTGVAWLEFPSEVTPLLFLSFLVMAGWGVVTFCTRRNSTASPSQWYIFGAMFWFPWLYATAQAAVVFFPVRGVVQAIIAGWYSQGLFELWLTSLALGVLYYLVPNATGRPTKNLEYATLGFWSLIILAIWTSAKGLVGGPVPAWVITVGVAAGVVLILPTVLISLNLHSARLFSAAFKSPTHFLLLASAVSFTTHGLLDSAISLRCAQRVLHFTQFPPALRELQLFGFIFFALFAGIHTFLGRIGVKKSPFEILGGVHVALSVFGVFLVIVPMLLGGWRQGFLLADSQQPFLVSVAAIHPAFLARTAGLALLLIGQLALAGKLALTLFNLAKPLGKPALALFIETETVPTSR
jgi:cytochrome c oxidase cbb3-type subunit I